MRLNLGRPTVYTHTETKDFNIIEALDRSLPFQLGPTQTQIHQIGWVRGERFYKFLEFRDDQVCCLGCLAGIAVAGLGLCGAITKAASIW